MAVMIGMVADNGLFIGGVGATTADALGSACEVLGEDFELFATMGVEDAHNKIDQGVGNVGGASPRPVAPGLAGAGAGGAADVGAAEGADAPAPAVESDSGVVDDADGGDDESASGGGAGATGASAEAAEPEGPVCTVCGAAVTPDRAEVSIEEHGTVQCRKCSVE